MRKRFFSLTTLRKILLHGTGFEFVRVPEFIRMQRVKYPELPYHEAVFEQYASAPITRLSIEEIEALSSVIHSLSSPGPIIEFGTLFGDSTRILVAANSGLRHIITVDDYRWNPIALPPDLHVRLTRESLKRRNTHPLGPTVITSSFEEFQAQYQGEAPALVFIDGDHQFESTKREIDWALAAGSEVICGHDYHGEHEPAGWGVVAAVNSAGGIQSRAGSFWVLNQVKQ